MFVTFPFTFCSKFTNTKRDGCNLFLFSIFTIWIIKRKKKSCLLSFGFHHDMGKLIIFLYSVVPIWITKIKKEINAFNYFRYFPSWNGETKSKRVADTRTNIAMINGRYDEMKTVPHHLFLNNYVIAMSIMRKHLTSYKIQNSNLDNSKLSSHTTKMYSLECMQQSSGSP